MTLARTLSLSVVVAFVAACGGSSTDAGPAGPTPPTPPAGQTIVVATAPAEGELEPGGSMQFSAQVTGTANGAVRWSVDEADGGTVSSSGLYTAPATEGTYHVRAESVAALEATATLRSAVRLAGGTSAAKGGSASVVHVKKNAVSPPPAVAVAVSPTTATVPAGGTQGFAAAVSGSSNISVTWTIQEGSSCGSVSAAGVYTAPNAGATCHVVVTSAADPTKSASATVTVTPPPVTAVAVSPSNPSVVAGGSITFTATITGTSAGQSAGVTWSANAGTINASTGVYTAPVTPGSYVVVATSKADATKYGSTAVIVTAAPVIAVSVTPATATVQAGGTTTFTANVTGTSAGQSTAVTWSVPAGAGTINASTGVYVAPATPGTYVVTATSVADGTKKGTATVTVTALPVAIAISPTTATLDACKGQVFTATVSNASNTAVTWSVVEAGGGAVVNGAYTAPSTAGTYHVKAVSQADPTKTVQATVTVGAEKVLSVAVNPGSGT
ncbi:MAG TPA: hypothetical protein PLL32_03285, partial [Anaeromyxobacteraceae bacterium]|nr:hypothetical protein [Anaeromyxobacteraceae bacterium]